MAKFYTVWIGKETGVFSNWTDCESNIKGVSNAKFKAFPSYNEANSAFELGYETFISNLNTTVPGVLENNTFPIFDSISVDGACNQVTSVFEYQCVCTSSGKLLFHCGPFENGTNNIAEFLALVDAIKYCISNNINKPIYSDSVTAICWVNKKAVKTNIPFNDDTTLIHSKLDESIKYLKTLSSLPTILKWETSSWGEIKADFGRK